MFTISSQPKILIAGASGFIGTSIIQYLTSHNYQLLQLTRNKENHNPSKCLYYWNPSDVQTLIHNVELTKEYSSISGIINLAGYSISHTLWTSQIQDKIYNSRIQSTKALLTWLDFHQSHGDLDFFIQSSAVGFYGVNCYHDVTEDSSSDRTGFLSKVCQDWEGTLQDFAQKTKTYSSCRFIIARLGMVLHSEAKIWKHLILPIQLGLGYRLGRGNQWYSWIDLKDVLKAFFSFITNNTCRGIYNVTAPTPIQQKDILHLTSRYYKQRVLLYIPEFIIKFFLGKFGRELLLGSQKAYPKRLLEEGFIFNTANWSDILKKYG